MLRCFLRWLSCVLVVSMIAVSGAAAQGIALAEESRAGFIARIELHTVEELFGVLRRAEALFDSGKIIAGVDKPIVFVLHGPEAKALFRVNYRDHKPLADLAARLSALKVVDVKVCKRWLGSQSLDAALLLPFVGTVPSGPDEIRRLESRQYTYF